MNEQEFQPPVVASGTQIVPSPDHDETNSYVSDVPATQKMDLLCFGIRDRTGRLKLLGINVLRLESVAKYGPPEHERTVSVGRSSNNPIVRGSFTHRGESLATIVDLRYWCYEMQGEFGFQNDEKVETKILELNERIRQLKAEGSPGTKELEAEIAKLRTMPLDGYGAYVVVPTGNALIAILAERSPLPFKVKGDDWREFDLRANSFYSGGNCERAAEITAGECKGELVDILDLDQLLYKLNPNHFDEKLRSIVPTQKQLLKILGVDDSRTARMQFSKILTQAGISNFQIFEDSEDLYRHMRSIGSENVGLIVTDLEMDQGSGGLGLITRIRKDESFKDVPILAWSGLLNDSQRRRVQELGANDSVDKGDPQELYDKIYLYCRS